MSQFPEQDLSLIRQDVDALKHKPGALLPILHAIQKRFGYVPKAAVPIIAEALQQTRAEIHGVISFYHHFRTSPPGSHVVQICRAESCQAMGARQLEGHAKKRLRIDYHQTTADGRITLEPVYCLGNCACSPSVSIDDRVYARVSSERFDELTEALRTRVLEVQ